MLKDHINTDMMTHVTPMTPILYIYIFNNNTIWE